MNKTMTNQDAINVITEFMATRCSLDESFKEVQQDIAFTMGIEALKNEIERKRFIGFERRKKLDEEYKEFLKSNEGVKDCSFTVISWLVSKGYIQEEIPPINSGKLVAMLEHFKKQVINRKEPQLIFSTTVLDMLEQFEKELVG